MPSRIMNDEEMLDMIREVRAWKERDSARTEKYARLMKNYRTKRRNKYIAGIVISVSIAMVVIILLPWPRNEGTKDLNATYIQYYEPFRFAQDYRDGLESSNQIYQQAISSYRENQWTAARDLSDSLLVLDASNPDYILISGLSKQAIGEYEDAILKFQSLNSFGGSYALHAHWYLSLIYLKEGKILECRQELEKLKQNKDSAFQHKVDGLLKQIKKKR
jgi:hypothetical protein